MDYIDGIADAPFDLQASYDEAKAHQQMALDVLYRIGCQFDIAKQDMVVLCQLANVDYRQLETYSGTPAAC